MGNVAAMARPGVVLESGTWYQDKPLFHMAAKEDTEAMGTVNHTAVAAAAVMVPVEEVTVPAAMVHMATFG